MRLACPKTFGSSFPRARGESQALGFRGGGDGGCQQKGVVEVNKVENFIGLECVLGVPLGRADMGCGGVGGSGCLTWASPVPSRDSVSISEAHRSAGA